MTNTWFPCVVLASCLAALAAAQNPADRVKSLLDKAANMGDPAEWAKCLMQADAEAQKLERKQGGGCCGNRCVRIDAYDLHYRFNEIQGQENYQHDLLQTIALAHEGDPDGAEALVRLLPDGCQTSPASGLPTSTPCSPF